MLPLGCATEPSTVLDTAQLPAGAFGPGGDADVTALNVAARAFADPSRTYGRPVEAARAAAAMDYVGGEFNTSPRWAFMPPALKDQLRDGREQVREAIGVVPGTPSQQVVDHLLAAARALDANDQDAAVQQLGPPVFNAPGKETLDRLAKLPYLQTANVSTLQAADQVLQGEAETPF